MSKETHQLIESWPWEDLLQRRLLNHLLEESVNSHISNLHEKSEVPLSLRAMVAVVASTGLASRWSNAKESLYMSEDLISDTFETLVVAGYSEHLTAGFLLCLVSQYNDGPCFSRQDLGELAYFAGLYVLSGEMCYPSLPLVIACLDFAIAEGYSEGATLRNALHQAETGSISAKQEVISFASQGWALRTAYEAAQSAWCCNPRYRFLWQVCDDGYDPGEVLRWALDVSIPAPTMVIVAKLLFHYGKPQDANNSIKLLVKAGSQGFDSAWDTLLDFAFRHSEHTSWALEETINSCRELFVSDKLR